MSPQDALLGTATFTAKQARLSGEGQATARPFLVLGSVLLTQQAASLSLLAAGDIIPAQAGATELVLRAAHPRHLPPPYTLPFAPAARQRFDQLIIRRNAFMHPRGLPWQIGDTQLAGGLSAVCKILTHLLITQPISSDLLPAADLREVELCLGDIAALAQFLA